MDYFKKHRHAVIPSSPVIPHDDPTLLFINAGMNQFKDVFLGKVIATIPVQPLAKNASRVGGKHNDLENVGHTNRHLTFFEMLGNFSFGDYFKEEAIRFAWEVSTSIFGYDPAAFGPLFFARMMKPLKSGLNMSRRKRITRMDEKDNFWEMGDTGPCGPCSELYYDRGPEFGQAISPAHDQVGDRFLEFWNLVFMQYNRQSSGKNEPLPKPSDRYGSRTRTDSESKNGGQKCFRDRCPPQHDRPVEAISGISYHPDDQRSPAFRVIADHLRCLAFAIADGVQPSNVDRGYVLRKVLRRAVRYGRMLGMDRPFLAEVLPQLVSTMGSIILRIS